MLLRAWYRSSKMNSISFMDKGDRLPKIPHNQHQRLADPTKRIFDATHLICPGSLFSLKAISTLVSLADKPLSSLSYVLCLPLMARGFSIDFPESSMRMYVAMLRPKMHGKGPTRVFEFKSAFCSAAGHLRVCSVGKTSEELT